jgi:hypothetical protein
MKDFKAPSRASVAAGELTSPQKTAKSRRKLLRKWLPRPKRPLIDLSAFTKGEASA